MRAPLADRLDYARFEENVDRHGPIPVHCPDLGPCHVWTGYRMKNGYGLARLRGKQPLAHRVAFYFAHGRWPEPCALHRCDNRACVNEAHLFEGTIADNNADMRSKGRQASGERNRHARLTERDVRDIRDARCEDQREMALRFGVSQSTISRIRCGRTWACVRTEAL